MRIFSFAIVALTGAAVAAERPPLDPQAAIAAADAGSEHGVTGRFAMTVASTGVTDKGVFLNSTDDYRRPDDLTFTIKPVVAHELAKRYGAPAEAFFKGHRVVVDGIVRRTMIVDMFSGRPHGANRYQHEVRIDHPQQIVSID